MIKTIDHVGIAVDALEHSLPFWAEALGLEVTGIETVASEGVKVAMLGVGGSRIELLEPTSPDSAVGKFLHKRGQGIHHVTLDVSDLPGLLARLSGRGIPTIGDGLRPGASGRQVAFVHPRHTGGVLLELVSVREPTAARPAELGPGSSVLVYLREPSEKMWGVLRRLDTNGVLFEGIDLGSFDDWTVQIERGEESVVGPSLLFVPMPRVERILLDRSSGDLPSLAARFERRTGRTVQEILDETRSGD